MNTLQAIRQANYEHSRDVLNNPYKYGPDQYRAAYAYMFRRSLSSRVDELESLYGFDSANICCEIVPRSFPTWKDALEFINA